MKSYPKVWFLRHGETEWNAEGRVQGQTESVLSERGRVHAQQQAELMAPILAHNPPCIVSPLKRTRQTADIALGGRDYQTDDRLKEISPAIGKVTCAPISSRTSPKASRRKAPIWNSIALLPVAKALTCFRRG